MSSPAGVYGGFVDTQDVELDNVTDGIIYSQAQTILPFEVIHDVDENHTCTGYVEKLADLDNISLVCRAILTEPELPALANLSLVVNEKLPLKQWKVTYKSFSNQAAVIEGFAKMFNFKILDRGIDVVMVEFTIEFESGISGATVVTIT
jgi:hypothetical protein